MNAETKRRFLANDFTPAQREEINRRLGEEIKEGTPVVEQDRIIEEALGSGPWR